MSKNTVDRRTSSFKARDNVELIMNQVIALAESNFTRAIEAQNQDAGTWKTNGKVAEMSIEISTPYHDIEGKTIILRCGENNTVKATSEDTWLLEMFRKKLVNATFDLMEHVNVANGIYPITIAEFDERRLNQDRAMTDCYHILHILQQAIRFLHLKPSKIESIVALIDEEIKLIKGWRRSEYKNRDAIEKRENRQ